MIVSLPIDEFPEVISHEADQSVDENFSPSPGHAGGL